MKSTKRIQKKGLRNAFGRFYEVEKSSAILVTKQADGEFQIEQWTDPEKELNRPVNVILLQENPTTPSKKPSLKVEAQTPGGTQLDSARQSGITLNGVTKSLLFLSPVRKKSEAQDKVHYSKASLDFATQSPLKKRDAQKRKKKKDSILLEDISIVEVGELRETALHEQPKRRPLTQRQVMGGKSANDCKKEYYVKVIAPYPDRFDTDTISRERKLIDENFAIEHTHGHGYGISPESFSPQVRDNMGPAPEWTNTQTMNDEGVVRHFTALYDVKVKPVLIKEVATFKDETQYERVLGIDYETHIQTENDEVMLHNRYDATRLPERSTVSSVTDLPHTIRVIDALIESKPPSAKETMMDHSMNQPAGDACKKAAKKRKRKRRS